MDQKDIWDNEYSLNKNKWKKESADLPSLFRNKIVLEIGVGNAKTLKSIIRQKPKKVYSIDYSYEAIKYCKEKIKEKNVIFEEMDVLQMPFENETFDVAVCYYILNNLNYKEREIAIKEICRVLKIKGKLIFEDFAKGDFRQENGIKTNEKDTIKKKNGIVCHFFEKKEIEKLFNKFKSKNIILDKSHPLRGKKDIERRIIKGSFEK